MADKSGVSRQVVPLPEGGGAIAAIGETFAPDLFTGTGNLSIPISVPPGRRGLQPELRLSYSSGAGNGPFGQGWDLSVGQIARKTSRGIPRYRDSATQPEAHDTFVLGGADDLVPIATDGVTVRFRPRTDVSFVRAERVRSATDDFWRVRTKDGLVTLYGTPGAIGDDPATIADPTNRTRVFAWMPSLSTDPFGNRIEYRYRRDLENDGSRGWEQLYLETIRYVDFERDGERRFLVSVDLSYDERPDHLSHRRAGFEVRTRLRCRTIDVNIAEAGLLRRYALVYLDERVATGEVGTEALAANGVSLLSQVQLSGKEADRTQSLPPLEFGYTDLDVSGRQFVPLRSDANALPATSLADPDVELVGLFGNGLPDLIQMNGVARFWRNRGGGRFDGPATMAEVPAGVRLGDPGVQLGDMNGDGRPDLLVLSLSGYFPLRFTGRWSRDGFVRYDLRPVVDPAAPELRFVDLDGDGVVDALRTGVDFELFFNDPTAGWVAVETRPRRPFDQFPDVRFSDPRVKLGDLTGDGLQDIIFVEQGQVSFWPYLGHGRWGGRLLMENSPIFPDEAAQPGLGFDPRRAMVGDIDGDGRDDLLFVSSDRVTFWLNQGTRWGDAIEVGGAPPFAHIDAVRLVDMAGTGMPGVLWTSDRVAASADNYRYLDLTGGSKPYLLSRIDNHRGSVTTIEYVASTDYSIKDSQTGRPWATPLPFPVRVVARLSVTDALSNGRFATEFRYHHGYWDGAEREFRGFGMVEQLDTETFAASPAPGGFAPPTLTRTWFHQGPVGDEFGARRAPDFADEYWPGDPPFLSPELLGEPPLESHPAAVRADALRSLRGSVLRTEVYALDGTQREDRPYTVTEYLYGAHSDAASPTSDPLSRRCVFPHLLAQRVTQWERGDDAMTLVTRPGDYDEFGQPGTIVRVGVPRGRDPKVSAAPGQPYLVTRTTTTYASPSDPETYIVDRVARTTTEEIANDGSAALGPLLSAIAGDTTERHLLAEEVRFYDGESFTGLPNGRIGTFGAHVRTETLVLTPELVAAAFDRLPPYLTPGPETIWTDDHPPAFRDTMPPRAGYVFHDGGNGSAPGWYAVTYACSYDFQQDAAPGGRGLLTRERDPLGHEQRTDYDAFGLLVVTAADAAGLSTHIEYDQRVLQPRTVTDPNGNRRHFRYTPLGLVESVATMGKASENEGDTPELPSLRYVYDLDAFERDRQPLSVRTVSRVRHAADAPPDDREVVESVAYYDGFGRQLQVRSVAPAITFGDPGLDSPRFGDGVVPSDQDDEAGSAADVVARVAGASAPVNVTVTGVQRYDNKGRVVERFEPSFARGLAYRSPDEEQSAGRQVLGASTLLFYDPRGQVVRTVHPDGSEIRVIFGVPGERAAPDLADPDRCDPTPWEAYTYDANDNAGRSGQASSQTTRYAHHWDTPSSIVFDAFGRTVVSVLRNRRPAAPGEPLPDPDALVTTTRYDLRGNPIALIDPEGRTAYSSIHDLRNRPLRSVSIDGGDRWTVLDAVGRPVEEGNARGTLVLRSFDALGRPSCVWAREDASATVGLRARLEYGDGGSAGQDVSERASERARNRLGRLRRQYDGAGRFTCEFYDFKGNPRQKVREVLRDEVLLGSPGAGEADWGVPEQSALESRAATLLDERAFGTSVDYDALNRVSALRYPAEADGRRRTLVPTYNAAGAVERLELEKEPVIELVAYDSRGRRVLVTYGNGVMTRYAYDRRSSRLSRVRSERFARVPGAVPVLRPSNPMHPLQDCRYHFDLVGNVLDLRQRGPGVGVPAGPLGAEALDRSFHYDALYRLASATGRECSVSGGDAGCGEAAGTRLYTETFEYDRTDNLIRLLHQAGDTSGVTDYRIQAGTNRVESVDGGAALALEYDAAGNLAQMGSAQRLTWDHLGRLASIHTHAGDAEPSGSVRHLYALDGQRVKKVDRRQDGEVHTTVHVDGLFEHHRRTSATGSATESTTLHLMDGPRRIATLAMGGPETADAGPAVAYHLGDHLGSSEVVVGGTTLADSGFVNREEYAPYGQTTFGGFAGKRHRFAGAERDESGLIHQGNRYYAPWLGRWISPDPAGPVDGPNAYAYAKGNPLRFVDPTGTVSWDWAKSAASHVVRANVWAVESPWNWQKESLGIIWNGIESAWAHAPAVADNLWDWAKSHWFLSSVLAVGSATTIYFKGARLWDNVVVPSIRTSVNAVLGYAIGGTTGAVLGGISGAVQGFSMAYADSYDWKSGWSWAAFVLDNSWSQFNSLVGSGFAVANLWNPIDKQASKGSTTLVFENGWVPNYSTTLGNVTAGNRPDYQAHERSHAWQGRLFGPFYVPAVLINYEVATLLPYWLIWDRDEIGGFGDYFVEGIYKNTWHELISYEWF